MEREQHLGAHELWEYLRVLGLLRGGLDRIVYSSDFSSCTIERRKDTAEEEYDIFHLDIPEKVTRESRDEFVKQLKLKIGRKLIC
jgi:hypothetical protein